MSTSQHLALARQWRPNHFNDVVGQHHTVQALENALNKNQLHHAYLFTGTRGVGKTTIARLFAKAINCEQGIDATPCGTCSNCTELMQGNFVDCIEVDAASRTKVEDTRDLLEKIQYAPAKGRFKVYLIDEVHMLSGHSFNALLKTLEEPPEHVKFLLATTDPQKLPATVISRCLQFHLTPLPVQTIQQHLEKILQAEKTPFDSEALEYLAQAANGSVRDALSILEQAMAYGNGKVLTDDVKSMLGCIDRRVLHQVMNALQHSDASVLLETVTVLAAQGSNFDRALADLLSILHSVAVEQAVPGDNTDTAIQQWATQIPPEDIQLYYQIGLIGRRDASMAPTPQVAFEMTLLRMLAFAPDDTSAMEQRIQHTQQSDVSSPAPNTTTAPIDHSQWGQLLQQLSLTGIAKTIAQNCSLHTIEDNSMHLILDPSQGAILQKQYIEKIQQALCDHLNKPIKLNITTEESEQLSPIKQEQHNKQIERQQREQTILKDNNVQKIMETFDATVIKESITTINEDKT